MQVSEALENRHSTRAFLPKAIDHELIATVLRDAMKAPSWANSQPWDVFVASGETLARIRERYAVLHEQKEKANPDIPFPKEWSEQAKQCTKEMIASQREGEFSEAFQDFFLLNRIMFRAPAVVILCMDKVLSPWSLFDLGAFEQSLLLSATEQGLQTIPSIQIVVFPHVLRDELAIPENLNIVIGIALGYADDSHRINDFRTTRRTFEDVVRFSG